MEDGESARVLGKFNIFITHTRWYCKIICKIKTTYHSLHVMLGVGVGLFLIILVWSLALAAVLLLTRTRTGSVVTIITAATLVTVILLVIPRQVGHL